MTIKELIQHLQKHPSDTRVVVSGYEDGYNDIIEVKEVILQLNTYTEWYYGQHADAKNGGEKAVFLFGNNRIAEEA